MISRRLRLKNRNQGGFTLLELLVALAIDGVLICVIAAIIFQVSSVSSSSSGHMSAVKQVENAAQWISRDALMAQSVDTQGASGFQPLTLTWVDWDNTKYQVTYTIVNGELLRDYSVNDGQPSQTMISQNINPDSEMTNCQFANGVLNIKICASVQRGSKVAIETRKYQVVPRPT
jgi:prepilin-type N-terminal cleavage/methylation domain-containing protein